MSSLSGSLTEAYGKALLYKYLPDIIADPRCVPVSKLTNISEVKEKHDWINNMVNATSLPNYSFYVLSYVCNCRFIMDGIKWRDE